jgi:hypothetical protein
MAEPKGWEAWASGSISSGVVADVRQIL